jgi:hypothetical protein
MTRANPQAEPPRTWYALGIWRRRAAHQLAAEPLCRMCQAEGRVTPAKVADHVEEHGGNWNEFRLGKLQSLCAACHALKHGRASPTSSYGREIGADGWPLDPRHPANKAR